MWISWSSEEILPHKHEKVHWSGWATGAEDYISFHSCQHRTETIWTGSSKTGVRLEIIIWSNKSGFELWNLKHKVQFWCAQHVSIDSFCLVLCTFHCCGGLNVGNIFLQDFCPLVVFENCLNVTTYMSIVVSHILPFMTTVYPSSYSGMEDWRHEYPDNKSRTTAWHESKFLRKVSSNRLLVDPPTWYSFLWVHMGGRICFLTLEKKKSHYSTGFKHCFSPLSFHDKTMTLG